MSRIRRFSIAGLMVGVLFLAADFAVVRWTFRDYPPISPVGAIACLPMINLLVIASPRAWQGRESRPFWLTFEVAGWSMLIAVLYLFRIYWEPLILPVRWLREHSGLEHDSSIEITFLLVCCAAIYTIPQVLIAFVVGWLSARYRVVIERR